MALAAGTYRIVSCLDPNVSFDVQGGSGAQGANLQLWSNLYDPTNTQVFDVVIEASGDYAGTCSIRSRFTGYAVSGGRDEMAVVAGANASMWAWGGYAWQRWRVNRIGSSEMMGGTMPTYEIESAAVPGLYLDASGGRAYAGTNVCLMAKSGAGWQGQWWCLVPTDAHDGTLPVPGAIAAWTSRDGSAAREVVCASGAVDLYPSWVGTGTAYQCRYRLRSRLAASQDAACGAWGPWLALGTGAADNDGWVAGSANVSATPSRGRMVSDKAVRATVGKSGTDRVDVQFDVRAYGPAGRGGDCCGTVTAAYAGSVGFSAATWSPEHLAFTATHDVRGGSTVTVAAYDPSGAKFLDAYRWTMAGKADAVEVPTSALCGVPGEGACLFEWSSYSAADRTSASGSAFVRLSYASGDQASMPSFSEGEGDCIVLSFPEGTTGRHAWVVSGGESHEVLAGADGSWRLPYPFGAAFKVFCAATSA